MNVKSFKLKFALYSLVIGAIGFSLSSYFSRGHNCKELTYAERQKIANEFYDSDLYKEFKFRIYDGKIEVIKHRPHKILNTK